MVKGKYQSTTGSTGRRAPLTTSLEAPVHSLKSSTMNFRAFMNFIEFSNFYEKVQPHCAHHNYYLPTFF